MKRKLLQVIITIAGLLMFFRFGGPALFFGATGPGPFGERWLTDQRTATLLLDADIRFFGAMMLGLGVIFFSIASRPESFRSLIYILAGAVALGAAARIYALITYGSAGPAGTIPIMIEAGMPIAIVALMYGLGKDARPQ